MAISPVDEEAFEDELPAQTEIEQLQITRWSSQAIDICFALEHLAIQRYIFKKIQQINIFK